MTESKYEELRLGDLVSRLESGVSVRADHAPPAAGEVGVLKVSCLTGGRFDATESKRVPSDQIPNLASPVRKGRVIISRSNTPELVGLCAYVSVDHLNLFLPDTLWQMEFSEERESDPRWLAYLLSSPAYREQLSRNASGTSANMKKLQKSSLLRMKIRVPPLPEQRKIAEILRTWDEAIEAATKLVTALNARREALRTKLVTEADIGGRLTVFGEFLKESRILGSDGASARKITVKLYGKGAVPKSDRRDGSTKTRYYRRSPGQLIYSKLDFLNGAFALVPESLQGYETSLDLPAFDISEHVNSKWLIEYLTRPAYYTAQLYLARGQRKARRIAPDDFLASPVKLPQRARQDEIAELFAVADREIALRETELDTLTRQKRGLMQKLLTGEWRVKL